MTGNKILLLSALSFITAIAIAQEPNLVEFTANTPAKAEEVNSNFNQ